MEDLSLQNRIEMISRGLDPVETEAALIKQEVNYYDDEQVFLEQQSKLNAEAFSGMQQQAQQQANDFMEGMLGDVEQEYAKLAGSEDAANYTRSALADKSYQAKYDTGVAQYDALGQLHMPGTAAIIEAVRRARAYAENPDLSRNMRYSGARQLEEHKAALSAKYRAKAGEGYKLALDHFTRDFGVSEETAKYMLDSILAKNAEEGYTALQHIGGSLKGALEIVGSVGTVASAAGMAPLALPKKDRTLKNIFASSLKEAGREFGRAWWTHEHPTLAARAVKEQFGTDSSAAAFALGIVTDPTIMIGLPAIRAAAMRGVLQYGKPITPQDFPKMSGIIKDMFGLKIEEPLYNIEVTARVLDTAIRDSVGNSALEAGTTKVFEEWLRRFPSSFDGGAVRSVEGGPSVRIFPGREGVHVVEVSKGSWTVEDAKKLFPGFEPPPGTADDALLPQMVIKDGELLSPDGRVHYGRVQLPTKEYELIHKQIETDFANRNFTAEITRQAGRSFARAMTEVMDARQAEIEAAMGEVNKFTGRIPMTPARRKLTEYTEELAQLQKARGHLNNLTSLIDAAEQKAIKDGYIPKPKFTSEVGWIPQGLAATDFVRINKQGGLVYNPSPMPYRAVNDNRSKNFSFGFSRHLQDGTYNQAGVMADIDRQLHKFYTKLTSEGKGAERVTVTTPEGVEYSGLGVLDTLEFGRYIGVAVSPEDRSLLVQLVKDPSSIPLESRAKAVEVYQGYRDKILSKFDLMYPGMPGLTERADLMEYLLTLVRGLKEELKAIAGGPDEPNMKTLAMIFKSEYLKDDTLNTYTALDGWHRRVAQTPTWELGIQPGRSPLTNAQGRIEVPEPGYSKKSLTPPPDPNDPNLPWWEKRRLESIQEEEFAEDAAKNREFGGVDPGDFDEYGNRIPYKKGGAASALEDDNLSNLAEPELDLLRYGDNNFLTEEQFEAAALLNRLENSVGMQFNAPTYSKVTGEINIFHFSDVDQLTGLLGRAGVADYKAVASGMSAQVHRFAKAFEQGDKFEGVSFLRALATQAALKEMADTGRVSDVLRTFIKDLDMTGMNDIERVAKIRAATEKMYGLLTYNTGRTDRLLALRYSGIKDPQLSAEYAAKIIPSITGPDAIKARQKLNAQLNAIRKRIGGPCL